MEDNKRSIIPLFAVVLMDMLGVGIIIPIIAPLILDPINGVLPVAYSTESRNIVLGVLIGVFTLFQFFGAPILGAMSDKYGRKKLLMASIFGSMVGYILFAMGIMLKNIHLLFLGRIIAGFMGGNISIAFSSIADISDEKSKPKNFGLIGMAFGFGFIIGPYIGGKLADPNLISWFNFSTPLWFAALLSFINILLVRFMLKETLHTRMNTKISVLTGLKNIKRAFMMKNLRVAFLVIFLHFLGFSFFAQFFQVLLIEKFDYNQVHIGNIFAYVGIWIAFTQGVVTRFISRYFSPAKVLRFSLVLLSIVLLSIVFIKNPIMFYFVMPFIALGQGVSFPNETAIVSNLSGKESQGEALGINQSIQSLALSIGPLMAGVIVSLNINLPILAASSIIFLAWLTFVTFFKESHKQIFHEV